MRVRRGLHDSASESGPRSSRSARPHRKKKPVTTLSAAAFGPEVDFPPPFPPVSLSLSLTRKAGKASLCTSARRKVFTSSSLFLRSRWCARSPLLFRRSRRFRFFLSLSRASFAARTSELASYSFFALSLRAAPFFLGVTLSSPPPYLSLSLSLSLSHARSSAGRMMFFSSSISFLTLGCARVRVAFSPGGHAILFTLMFLRFNNV